MLAQRCSILYAGCGLCTTWLTTPVGGDGPPYPRGPRQRLPACLPSRVRTAQHAAEYIIVQFGHTRIIAKCRRQIPRVPRGTLDDDVHIVVPTLSVVRFKRNSLVLVADL
jgi:hypothetical protein